MTKHTFIKIAKIFGFTLLILFVIVLGLSIWFYRTPESSLKNKLAKALPLPVVLVENHPITMNAYLKRLTLTKTYYANDKKITEKQLQKQTLDQLISEKKLNIIADSKHVSVSKTDLSGSMEVMMQQNQNFNQLISGFGLSESQFKDDILYPQILLTNLRIWFFSQGNLNTASYAEVDKAIQQANSTTFEQAVATFSQDEASKATKGDLGFIEAGQIAPDFKEFFDTAKLNEVRVVPSSYGIHIFKVLEKDNNGAGGSARIHLQQIFIGGSDFDSWLTTEKNVLKVKTLLAI